MEHSRRAPRMTPIDRVEGRAHCGADVRVLDVSASGALVESPRSLEKGSLLTLELDLEGTPLSVRSRVVHCTPTSDGAYRAGVQFEALPAGQRDRIRDLIRTGLEQERREQPRVYVGQSAQLTRDIELRVLNLSLFGGLFAVRFPLEFDSTHDFVFQLPSGDVRVRGVVRHCEAWAQARDAAIFRLGVEFTELEGEDRDRVTGFLEDQIQAS